MKRIFEEDFEKSKVIYVKIEDEEIEKVKRFCDEAIPVKKTENRYKGDPNKKEKRWFTGRLGEMAVEKLLNKTFCDWTIGKSKNYRQPDLSPLGYEIGIKTVEYGKYPIIKQNSKYPEIICVLLPENVVAICGLATVDVLNKYQDPDLVIDKRILYWNKNAFYGLEQLIPLDNLSVLETYRIA